MDTQTRHKHYVIFCGAGPGDPELITVKGRSALEAADLIIYAGSLVPEAVLQWARAGVEAVNSAGLHLDEIVTRMADAYEQGRRVVRLHTGDPSLYGAVFEQMAELQRRQIPYSVIPGVTAAFAAAAAMGLEYTLPEVSQTLILTRMAGRTPVPEGESLAALAAHRATMVIYLSIGLAEAVAGELITAYGPGAGCAVVYRASRPDQKIVYTRLDELASTVKAQGFRGQALIIVGRVLDVSLETLQHRSKLYDRHFAHGFRDARRPEEPGD